jgi:hypothetical protein
MDRYNEYWELDRQYTEMACRVPSPEANDEQRKEWHEQRIAKHHEILRRMRAIMPNCHPWVMDGIDDPDKSACA